MEAQDTELEVWKPLSGYSKKYEVSNMGNVRNDAGVILKPWLNKWGYLLIGLARSGTMQHISVHRLIGTAFLGVAPIGKEINHKNGIKKDNRIGNLEWLSRSENQLHATRVLGKRRGLQNGAHTRPENRPRGESQGASKLTEKDVAKIRLLKKTMSLSKLAAMFFICKSNVSSIVNNKTWRHV